MATTVPPTTATVPPEATVAGEAPGLRRIKGIGPSLERRLKDLGVRTMQDLAALDEAGVARIDEALDFKGRVARERWVEQARELLRS
jgi:predicted flap endonuclease-1-like 5' DNA nuclease